MHRRNGFVFPSRTRAESVHHHVAVGKTGEQSNLYICDLFFLTTQTTWKFCYELRKIIPNSEIFGRKKVSMKKAVKQAIEREYTDIILVNEDNKVPSECVRVCAV